MSTFNLIPSANPHAEYEENRAAIDEAIQRVLGKGHYILGPEVEAFEREFAAFLGATGCVGVGSGTEALHLALRALGLGAGDSVITVSHTAVATVSAVELAGATPVLVDVDPRTFTLDVAALERVLSGQLAPKPKAIVPVHLYGHPANMREIMELARRHGLFVIEDCAQAHGAQFEGRMVGTFGHLAAFSFYPTKNLGAMGDAGAVVANDPDLIDRVRFLRQYGWRERYLSEIPGLNSRLDELQAAVLRVKLKNLASRNNRRRTIAASYGSRLESTCLRLPEVVGDVVHAFHQYTVLAPERDVLVRALQRRQVGSAILYPVPVHLQAAYRGRLILPLEGLPVTEAVCQHLLCLPVFPELADDSVNHVAQAMLSSLDSAAAAAEESCSWKRLTA
jgi:dTDP-4-amino-4,6-dideoxygalactose transaminase